MPEKPRVLHDWAGRAVTAWTRAFESNGGTVVLWGPLVLIWLAYWFIKLTIFFTGLMVIGSLAVIMLVLDLVSFPARWLAYKRREYLFLTGARQAPS